MSENGGIEVSGKLKVSEHQSSESKKTNCENSIEEIHTSNAEEESAKDIQEAQANKIQVEDVQLGKTIPNNNSIEEMTVIDEVTDESLAKNSVDPSKQSSSIEPDTEMVSEDELPSEGNKEPETEAVSDEELPVSGDLPDTEAVSDDELPPERSDKKKKKLTKSTTPKSTDSAGKDTDSLNPKGVKRKLDNESSDASSGVNNETTPAVKKPAPDNTPSNKSKSLPELEKYWKAVKEDASDFTGWTYLLQYVDQENDVEAAREAYDAFLSNYPYCYGYWRKYADYEKRKGNLSHCEEVFERGLKAIPLSVDLWIHYLNHCKTTLVDDKDQMRSIFERSIEACGLEFRSDRLWDAYLKWEIDNKNLQNITKIYDKLLSVPTQNYQSHFDKFCEHVNSNLPDKVVGTDELQQLRQEIKEEMKADLPSVPGNDGDAPPGEEISAKDDNSVVSPKEMTKLREKIVAARKTSYLVTKKLVDERQTFEDGIKRPYFHVKALERCQLKNWKEYLVFEISQKDKKRIIILFERCLIACALYEELWLRYVRYLEEHEPDDVDSIRNVYERACNIHHRKKPNIHLHWSVYEETQGNFKKSEEILDHLEKLVPNLTQVIYRRINLARRSGEMDKVCDLYEHYIKTSKSKIMANNMTIKYARFCWKILNNVDKAVCILKKTVDEDQENPRFYLQLIDMAMHREHVNEHEIVNIIDIYLARESADLEQRVMFAQRKIEFLEDFGTSIKSIQKATEDFKKLLKQLQEARKKKNDFKSKDESNSKKTKADHKEVSHPGPSQMSQPPPPLDSAPHYNQGGGYNQPPPQGYQGGYNQPPYNQQYNQPPYNQGDPNYNNYQNWGYNQNYNNYNNQGWGSYNNYY